MPHYNGMGGSFGEEYDDDDDDDKELLQLIEQAKKSYMQYQKEKILRQFHGSDFFTCSESSLAIKNALKQAELDFHRKYGI
jgi:hypothetical protein